MARVDPHLHTQYSPDSLNELADVVARCRRAGLTHIAVTDHNTLDGALALKEVSPLPVILGEEILTREGEIIGLFLQQWVPPHRSALETVEAIKAQGGLVYIPHPADPLRRALRPEALERVRGYVDVLEVFNARCVQESSNRIAASMADRLGCARAAASDAHTLPEIGRSYVECAAFETATEFVAALASARLQCRRSPRGVHLLSRYAALRHRFGRQAPTGAGGERH
jgi:predicted metal-dependent phosphoesterase TrpH